MVAHHLSATMIEYSLLTHLPLSSPACCHVLPSVTIFLMIVSTKSVAPPKTIALRCLQSSQVTSERMVLVSFRKKEKNGPRFISQVIVNSETWSRFPIADHTICHTDRWSCEGAFNEKMVNGLIGFVEGACVVVGKPLLVSQTDVQQRFHMANQVKNRHWRATFEFHVTSAYGTTSLPPNFEAYAGRTENMPLLFHAHLMGGPLLLPWAEHQQSVAIASKTVAGMANQWLVPSPAPKYCLARSP